MLMKEKGEKALLVSGKFEGKKEGCKLARERMVSTSMSVVLKEASLNFEL